MDRYTGRQRRGGLIIPTRAFSWGSQGHYQHINHGSIPGTKVISGTNGQENLQVWRRRSFEGQGSTTALDHQASGGASETCLFFFFLLFFFLINITPFSLTQSIFFGLPWPYGILCGRSTHPHWCQTPIADRSHSVCIKHQRHRETDTAHIAKQLGSLYQLEQTHHQSTSKHHKQTEEKSNRGD